MKKLLFLLGIGIILSSCMSSRISSNLAAGAIGCSPNEITILNETATFIGSMHNFDAICGDKYYICSYQPTTGINCTERAMKSSFFSGTLDEPGTSSEPTDKPDRTSKPIDKSEILSEPMK